MADALTAYQRAVAAGLEVDGYESDLYIKVSPESDQFVKGLKEEEGICSSQFTSTEGDRWYELPFLYDPFWEDKYKKRKAAGHV